MCAGAEQMEKGVEKPKELVKDKYECNCFEVGLRSVLLIYVFEYF